MKWYIFTGLLTEKGWVWTVAGKRSGSAAGKALARKLARDHEIKADFADGRAVAFGAGDYTPTGATLICNKNGNFYPLSEIWPMRTGAA